MMGELVICYLIGSFISLFAMRKRLRDPYDEEMNRIASFWLWPILLALKFPSYVLRCHDWIKSFVEKES